MPREICKKEMKRENQGEKIFVEKTIICNFCLIFIAVYFL